MAYTADHEKRARAIVARFTTDPKITAKIMGYIEKANHGDITFDEIMIQEGVSPDMRARVKDGVNRISSGFHVHAVTGYHQRDQSKAVNASEIIHQHKGAIGHIIQDT